MLLTFPLYRADEARIMAPSDALAAAALRTRDADGETKAVTARLATLAVNQRRETRSVAHV